MKEVIEKEVATTTTKYMCPECSEEYDHHYKASDCLRNHAQESCNHPENHIIYMPRLDVAGYLHMGKFCSDCMICLKEFDFEMRDPKLGAVWQVAFEKIESITDEGEKK